MHFPKSDEKTVEIDRGDRDRDGPTSKASLASKVNPLETSRLISLHRRNTTRQERVAVLFK